MKDKRFITAGILIRTNEMKSFSGIIDVIPKTVVAKSLGINTERFNRLLGDISLFVVKDLDKLADLLEVDTIAVLTLVSKDLPKRKGKK